FTFSYPAGWTLTEGNNSVQLNQDGATIVFYGPENLARVFAGMTFDDDAAALTFFVERVGLETGEHMGDMTPVAGELARTHVTLARRDQEGIAVLLDVGHGRQMIATYLHGETADVPAFAEVVASLSYPGDLVDVALSNSDFSILVAAVQAAGLEETLRTGTFTVFAPTNAAFEAALATLGLTAEQALADTATLTSILTYHVVEGVVTSADVQPGKVTTVQGDPLTIRVRGDQVRVNNARVVAVDVPAFNGVIHVIDSVLLPPAIETPLIAAQLPELLARSATFSDKFTFSYPVGIEPAFNNDVAELKRNEATLLVYGPTAYTRVAGAVAHADDQAALTFFLDRVGGYEPGAAITEGLGDNVLAASAVSLPRRQQEGQAYLIDLKNNRVGVVVALSGRDAFSLAVRDFLQAKTLDTLAYPPDLVDVASSNSNFTLLVSAVAAAGLVDTLRDGEFTVFAPTNAAFSAALDQLGVTTAQLLENTELLTSILTYHVVPGTVLSTDLVEGDVTTVNGAPITISLANGPQVNGINIVTADLTAANGVIHVIDGVLVPPLCVISTDQVDTIRMRVGPGTNRAAVAFLPAGVSIDAIGQFTTEAGDTWYSLDLAAAGAPPAAAAAWVLAADVTVTGAGCALVPATE
ncbi:MAG: fasciclin domain-containing protein, partial [Anaerolineae bacterium]|nr:fasciclin domain-containing protein [Anaerolineae bacterium]